MCPFNNFRRNSEAIGCEMAGLRLWRGSFVWIGTGNPLDILLEERFALTFYDLGLRLLRSDSLLLFVDLSELQAESGCETLEGVVRVILYGLEGGGVSPSWRLRALIQIPMCIWFVVAEKIVLIRFKFGARP